MAFTIEQYNALTDAIAAGTTTVTYGDKTVSYRSLNDMLRIVALIEARLFPENKPARRKYAEYTKGIYTQNTEGSDECFR